MKTAERTSEKKIERMTKAELNETLRVEIAERKQAEESLRASQSKLASITGSTMDAIITIDADQRIILFNTAADANSCQMS